MIKAVFPKLIAELVRNAVVRVVEVLNREAELLHIVGALHTTGRFARRLDGREKQTNKNTDDRDNDQQFNLLIIKNGRAYVKDASCPDGICSSHSKIYRDGESIVCLPNRVVVTVVSSSNDDAPDTTA